MIICKLRPFAHSLQFAVKMSDSGPQRRNSCENQADIHKFVIKRMIFKISFKKSIIDMQLMIPKDMQR